MDVETAKTTAQSALGAANALSTTVTGLKNFTDSAFADGVVTRSEAAAIGKLTNQVAETAESVKAQYYNRYNHADLNETGKRNLAAKYALFDAAKAALLTSITTAIADGIATAAEQADVDTKHNAFNSALSDLNVAFGVADEAIRDAIRAYADSAVGTGQNAVAKNIGFSSYEDMTAKAEAGQHDRKRRSDQCGSDRNGYADRGEPYNQARVGLRSATDRDTPRNQCADGLRFGRKHGAAGQRGYRRRRGHAD